MPLLTTKTPVPSSRSSVMSSGAPKYRLPVLVGAVAERLKALLNEKAAEMESIIQAMKVMRTTCISSWTCRPR